MLPLGKRLQERERPIGVGIIGAGYMGGGILNAVSNAVNMRPVVVFDKSDDLAREAALRYSPDTHIAQSVEEVCTNGDVEVVVDGTASPRLGAEAAVQAIENRKHFVSINIECDVTVGRALKAKADEADVVYTVIAGDEPGDLKGFYDHYHMLGYKIVALGKGKNNPLNTKGTPETVKAKLPDNGITAQQVASFVDGSKTMFEMGCVGNAVGFSPDVAGMHGPESTIAQLSEIFRSKEEGGILEREGVVDYVTGTEISGGIFIVVRIDDERTRSDFNYLKIGSGPYYAFYQRYHNWFVDTPLSIARAVLNKEETIAPLPEASCQVVAVAKRDIKAGEILDGIGGFCAYGLLEDAQTATRDKHLPLGLIEGSKATRPVSAEAILTLDDIELPKEGEVLQSLWVTC